ncbi:hypothetical protein [Leifsonia aquatica]|uniref:Uncharacterized protein n=2 Tax=Leifsonia aquatica TaxID=144185 RepID=U2RT39_LEIAQ|nr:hypothetical protein [Leifsonia aquatica]ERK71724.1 hypothetical protein N136_01927 [Leifsonia aquatica ATCC 14665]MBB2968095.1 hypothetical protein [Leifsonia aquatica]
MLSTTKVRAASVLGAVAVAGALSLSAVPANAAGAEISLASSTFTIGDWGSGIAVTGSGFDLDADVTVSLVDVESTGPTVLDSIITESDDAGAILLDWTPTANAMTADYDNGYLAVVATDGSGNLAAEVPLTLFAPEGIWTDAATITTAELADENVGAIVWAGGYTPGESVTTTIVYNGYTFEHTDPADRFGGIAFSWSLVGGTVEAGTIDFTVVGADSKLSQSISVAVTGPTIELGGAPDGEVTPVQVSPAGGAVTSPRVAG